ncbi:uncharacterized protein [Onthophagus taurus]|uniref:uncharacterized protein n=1 Tax=Onthophagus taurus TaxID=166361 RepID=UPI000C20A44D|nr:uncharacterized protein LOC111420651 [Onthophagus taurus]
MAPPDVTMRPGWLIQKRWLSEQEAVQCLRTREFRRKQIRGSGYRDQETILQLRTFGEYYQQIINMDHCIPAHGNAMIPPLIKPLGGTVERVVNIERVMEHVVKIATTTTSVQPPPGFCYSMPFTGRYIKPVNSYNFNDDLDINAIIGRFKNAKLDDDEIKTNFENNQKTLLLRKFVMDSIISDRMVKPDQRTKDICKTLFHMSSEKLVETTYDFLKAVGFDGILSHKSICSESVFDELAQEVCFNDTLVSEVASACNAFSADKNRMEYVAMLEYYTSLE